MEWWFFDAAADGDDIALGTGSFSLSYREPVGDACAATLPSHYEVIPPGWHLECLPFTFSSRGRYFLGNRIRALVEFAQTYEGCSDLRDSYGSVFWHLYI